MKKLGQTESTNIAIGNVRTVCIGVSSSAIFNTVSADCVSVLETGNSLLMQISLNGGLKCRLYEKGDFFHKVFLLNPNSFSWTTKRSFVVLSLTLDC